MKQAYSTSPVNIPKSGKKIHNLHFCSVFIRRLKNVTFVYEVTSGVQLMCVSSTDWDDARICQYIVSRQNTLEEFMQLEFIITDDNTLVLPEQG